MRKTQKVCALFLSCMLVFLQSCGTIEYKEENKITGTPSVTKPVEENKITEKPDGEVTLAPSDTIELQIYSLASNLQNVEAVTALVPSDIELTPEVILEVVLEAMADTAYFIEIANVSTKEEMIIVDFYEQGPPVTNTGSAVESAILDAIGQSLLDNLDNYTKVSYTIEGKAYETGHIVLALGESYIER